MTPKVKRMEWSKIGEFSLFFFFFPLILFLDCAYLWPEFLNFIYVLIVTLFLVQAGITFSQTTRALLPSKLDTPPPAPNTVPPRTTFIISAYLPNEITTIETTLLNLLQNVQKPRNGLEVILAYNTPHLMELETRLCALAKPRDNLILANAYGARSKSQNQNYALSLASGEMIVLLNADQLVEKDCIDRAWCWLGNGYDAVYGRRVIRNGNAGRIPTLASVDLQAWFGIHQVANFRRLHTLPDGESNGYWRASVLKALQFKNDRLTEDTDAALRAALAGYRIMYDRNLLASEEAPDTCTGLWFQRKRWAQGRCQCAAMYQKMGRNSPHLTWQQKTTGTLGLLWSAIYSLMSPLLPPVLIVYWLCRERIEFPVTPYILFVAGVFLASSLYNTIGAWILSTPRYTPRRYLLYSIVGVFYAIYKNIIRIVAIRDELAGSKEWNMPSRNPNMPRKDPLKR